MKSRLEEFPSAFLCVFACTMRLRRTLLPVGSDVECVGYDVPFTGDSSISFRFA